MHHPPPPEKGTWIAARNGARLEIRVSGSSDTDLGAAAQEAKVWYEKEGSGIIGDIQ
jgi:hypothetical protein